jgi:TetR/AcrR family transcriptional regulator
VVKSSTGKKRDANRTKASILQSAISEFALRGPAGTRVDEIALRAGVNKSLIYQYFGSKQELYAEALNSVLLTITERSAHNSQAFADAAAKGDVLATVRAFVESHLSLLEAVPEYPRLMAWENLEGGRTLARLPLQQTYNLFLKRVQEVLAPLAKAGMLSPDFDLRQAAQAVIALTHYFIIYRGMIEHLFHQDPASQQTRGAWLDYCAGMLLSSLRPKPV